MDGAVMGLENVIELIDGGMEDGGGKGGNNSSGKRAVFNQQLATLRRRRNTTVLSRVQRQQVTMMEKFQERMRQQEAMARREQMRRVEEIQRRAREAPNTWIGGVVLPLLVILAICACFASSATPEVYERERDRLLAAVRNGPIGRFADGAARFAQLRGWTLHDTSRVCVCLFFVHEGLKVFQLKMTEVEASTHVLRTPFGDMRSMPTWDKGDAADMVLLVTATATLLNLLPDTLGLVLMLVDVTTDTLDILARMLLTILLTGGSIRFDELTAKKLSLLGVTALLATHRWRDQRMRHPRREPRGGNGHGENGSAALIGSAEALELPIPPLVNLIGRLLMCLVFFHAAGTEFGRLLIPHSLSDLNPEDPHNVIWPKLAELALSVPFALGLRTSLVARALTATLALEALTCWQFWWYHDIRTRLHVREHFVVNVAVAGGLLLVQSVGGGKYAIDTLLKKDD